MPSADNWCSWCQLVTCVPVDRWIAWIPFNCNNDVSLCLGANATQCDPAPCLQCPDLRILSTVSLLLVPVLLLVLLLCCLAGSCLQSALYFYTQPATVSFSLLLCRSLDLTLGHPFPRVASHHSKVQVSAKAKARVRSAPPTYAYSYVPRPYVPLLLLCHFFLSTFLLARRLRSGWWYNASR